MTRIGVDAGGTFIGIVPVRSVPGDVRQVVVKVPVTPADQSEGVVRGVLEVCRVAEVAPGEVDFVFHGTTVATDMVIERSGVEVGWSPRAASATSCTWPGTSGRTIPRCSRHGVLDEFISVAHVQEVHGAGFDSVDDGYGFAVNAARAAARRAGMRVARG